MEKLKSQCVKNLNDNICQIIKTGLSIATVLTLYKGIKKYINNKKKIIHKKN